MLTLAVLAVVALVRGPAQVPGAMVFFATFSALVAVVLVASARALWRDRRWARSPVITWQVLLVVMAVGWLGVERTIGAAAVLGAAVLVTVCLLLPSVVAVTTGKTAPTVRHRGARGDHGPTS